MCVFLSTLVSASAAKGVLWRRTRIQHEWGHTFTGQNHYGEGHRRTKGVAPSQAAAYFGEEHPAATRKGSNLHRERACIAEDFGCNTQGVTPSRGKNIMEKDMGAQKGSHLHRQQRTLEKNTPLQHERGQTFTGKEHALQKISGAARKGSHLHGAKTLWRRTWVHKRGRTFTGNSVLWRRTPRCNTKGVKPSPGKSMHCRKISGATRKGSHPHGAKTLWRRTWVHKRGRTFTGNSVLWRRTPRCNTKGVKPSPGKSMHCRRFRVQHARGHTFTGQGSL